jgi:transcriptional regulator with XRE-family HTH domain
MIDIGKIIRASRECAGISQSDCAKMAGISKSYLCDIEKGRKRDPGIKTLERVATGMRAKLVIVFS